MYYRGDKYGDNKHDYKLGPVSDVSIVHYDAHVAKQDRVEMTQKVCFEFCRTVPNMGFFGIVNGRGCYCTPYFKPMESDSSQCDAACEGENTLMCGGKSKSSVFAMHMCASTADDLKTRTDAAMSLKATIDAKAGEAKGISSFMQGMSENLQKSFGAVGDSGATSHAQAGKVFAGKLVHKAEEAEKIAKALGELQEQGNALSDFTNPETVTKAERVMENVDETVAKGEAVSDELDDLLALAHDPKTKTDAAKQYYPVMHFVDKEFSDVPSTCAGDMVGQPIKGSEDDCATMCDQNIHACVGYQYFSSGSEGSCVLLSKLTSAFYYTGCGNEAAFLQTGKAAPFAAKCVAKLSKFEGTSIKPDASGKCKGCLKELTKADRCYAK
jgi:hypothetical protein